MDGCTVGGERWYVQFVSLWYVRRLVSANVAP